MRKIAIYLFINTLLISSLFSQKNIPNINLKTIDGKTINISEIISDDAFYIISFWATWCVPCINELDAINKIIDDWNKKYNIKVLAISTDDSRSEKRVRPLINGKKWKFEVYMDSNHYLKRALNISGIPHTITSTGSIIINRRVGYSPGEEKKLYDLISNYSK